MGERGSRGKVFLRPAAEQAYDDADLGDRLSAVPPLRELQNGPGTSPRKAGYAIATALTTGSKKLSSLLVGESICP